MGKKDFVITGGKTPVYNHYQLSIQALKNQRPDILLSVLRFSGEEALNTPWKYSIELTSATRDIPADILINSTAQLLFYPDGQPWQSVEPRILRGVVTAFQQCESSADETRYVVTLESRLALLKNSLTYAVYQHKSVPGVVEDILKRWEYSSLDYHFRLNTQYPIRDFYISYAESDLAFIERHLARIGVFYYFIWDEENHRDVLVLGDSAQAYGTKQSIVFRHPSGLFDGGQESLWDISVNRQSVAASTRLNDEYYRNAQNDMQAREETDPDKPALTGELYRYGENYQLLGKEYQALPEQGLWFAQRRQERLVTEQVTFDGMSNGMRFGLSQNEALLDSLWQQWQQAAMPLLRDASVKRLTTLMNSWRSLPPDSPQRADDAKIMYDLLKAYLMLAHPEQSDPAFFSTTLMKVWQLRDGMQDASWRNNGGDMLAFMMTNLPAHPAWQLKPDMRLVSSMRSALLRQIGASNAEATRYQKLMEQVSRDYADVTLSEMASDTDSSRLFNTEETVPGVFTRRAWEEAVQPAIEQAVKVRRDEIDWVLSDNKPASNNDVSPETLKARLTERYFSDYAGAWLKFFNSLQWQRAESLSESIEQLTLLADIRQSPLIALINTLNVQGRTGQTGGHLADSLVSSAKNLLSGDKTQAVSRPQGASGPMDDTFGPLLALTDSGTAAKDGLSLQTFLTRITRVRLRLQQVTNAPDPQAMMQSLALTVFQGKAVDLTDTRDYGSLIAASLGQEWIGFGQAVFVEPMVQAWEQVLSPTAESINSQWQNDIVTPWDHSFADRYPFANRQSDVSLPHLAQFMRTDSGRIAQFVNSRLGGLLRLEGDRWVPDAMNSRGLTFDPAFLNALNKLAHIASTAFVQGDVELHFQMMAKPSRDVVESELTVDRQKLQYFNQEESWQTLNWPDNRWQPQTTLTWRSASAGTRIYADHPGSWGLIRLLDKARITDLGSNIYRVVWPTPDGLTLNYQIRTELGSGPLALLELRGFRMPARIFISNMQNDAAYQGGEQ